MNALLFYMREPVPVYTENGMELVAPNICNRAFTLYARNGSDIQICEEYLRGYCFRKFCGGQMEHVLDDLMIVSYLHTPADVICAVHALRNMGVAGTIGLYTEYVNGYECLVKEYCYGGDE